MYLNLASRADLKGSYYDNKKIFFKLGIVKNVARHCSDYFIICTNKESCYTWY